MLDIFSVPWLWAILITFTAYYFRAITGFGHSLIMAPVLLIFLDPKYVVVLNLLLALLGSILLLPSAIKNRQMEKVFPMLIGAFLGVPVGTYIIQIISPAALKVLIGGLCAVLAVPLAFGFSIKVHRQGYASGVFGFLSGVSNAATSLGGPPAVIYMHSQNWCKEVTHSSLTFLFTFQISWSMVTLFLGGLLNKEVVFGAASLIPALLGGLGLGMLTFPKVNLKVFRFISVAMVIAGGIAGIISGLGVFYDDR